MVPKTKPMIQFIFFFYHLLTLPGALNSMPSKWDPFVIWHPPSWFSMWWEILDMTPQWVRECAIEKKIEKRNVPLEKRLVTIPYKGSRKKNTKEKAEIWIMSLWGHVFSSPLALHLRAEAQYDNLCNYLVPHIYNQGNKIKILKN